MTKLKPKIKNVSHLQMAENMITENEALTLHPYHDTVGKLTIGYGRNIEDRGITYSEAETMLANDIIEAHDELYTQFGFYKELSDVRKAVMMDLYHNLGITRLLGFKKMLRALQFGQFDEAAKELKDSRYYNQVGRRAQRNYCMLRFNKWYQTKEAESYFKNQKQNHKEI